jgi:hypothetical protein
MRRALLGELRFELLAEILGLRKFPLRLRDLGDERLAGASRSATIASTSVCAADSSSESAAAMR